ncbi:MAG: sugar ABC transporter ATP-binding protein [Candidatus Tectomicrobia bacterium]|nr:sugar ABC transporter ATP-binding protein [Candidatus Tectomicrobia bacterium]
MTQGRDAAGGAPGGQAGTLLAMRGISKSFYGVRALRGVDFDLATGEVHAIVGENGAGKSTLIKVLCGVLTAEHGSIELQGRRVQFTSPGDAYAAGLAVIHQERHLVPQLSVAENVCLRRLPARRLLGCLPVLNRRRMLAGTEQLLETLGVRLDPRAPVSALSPAEQQLVEIAKALNQEARILVMDEPTASLEAHEVEALFALIRRMKGQGTGTIFISHKIDEVYAIADRVTVLRDGEVAAARACRDLAPQEMIRLIVGRDVRDLYVKEEHAGAEVALAAQGYTLQRFRTPLSFEARRGEVLGLTGLLGSGCAEVLRGLFGAAPVVAGELVVGGRRGRARSPAAAIARGIAFVPENRQVEGLVMNLSVEANLILPNLRRVSRWGFLSRRAVRRLVTPLMQRFDIRAPRSRTAVKHLSGGNQQKVVLAKWFAAQASILALDEPTHGIDVGAKAEIHRIMNQFTGAGGSILLSSSELPEALGMSDRMLVFRGGRITARFERHEFSQERIVAHAAGMAS